MSESAPSPDSLVDVEFRARQSRGSSSDAIYRMVERELGRRQIRGGTLADVGCGGGHLWKFVQARFERYLGVDAVCFDGFPTGGVFHACNLDRESIPLPDACADVAAAVETIEHLENPRAFFRELVRVTKPGGWVVVTTPNQLSLLSKLTLLFKNQFNAFQDNSYPAHISALLEVDLLRMAKENGLAKVAVVHSGRGRFPSSGSHWPSWLSSIWPRAFSDNVMLTGCKL